jgi:hypothetical protein
VALAERHAGLAGRCGKQMERISAEIAALQREERRRGAAPAHAALQASLAAIKEEHEQHKERWQREQAVVAAIVRLRAGEEAPMNALKAELSELQGESPLVPLEVDGASVAAIVSGWTGIPLGRMVKDEIRTVLSLQARWKNASSASRTRLPPWRSACARRAPISMIRTSRKACSCSSARPASARPKPRWRWPTCCMAASANSSPST